MRRGGGAGAVMPWAEQTVDLSGWASVITSVASGGFAVGVAWYLLTRALPQMQDNFGRALTKMQDNFGAALAEERKLFAKSLEEQQAKFDLRDAARRTADRENAQLIREHWERRDEYVRAELTALTRATQDQTAILEEVLQARREKRRRRQPPPQGGA